MRTRQQFEFAYKGLTTGEFGERTGQSQQQVRTLIEAGWFCWTEDGIPECLDVSAPGSKNPSYRILPSAVKRYYQERAATGQKRAS